MADKRFGKNIIGELSDAQALPNATGVDSTNMVYVGGPTNGKLWINVYAGTAISIATGQAFNIELQSFSTDTAASAISPFSTSNGGGVGAVAGAGTSEDNAHVYLLHKTSADAQLDFSAGSLICEFAIPETMLNLISHTYVQLRYLTDANESSETITAFVYDKG